MKIIRQVPPPPAPTYDLIGLTEMEARIIRACVSRAPIEDVTQRIGCTHTDIVNVFDKLSGSCIPR